MAEQVVEHNHAVYSASSETYDAGRGDWFANDRVRMRRDIESMVERCPVPTKDMRVADLGCGTGHAAVCLAEAGARRVTAVDFIEDFVELTCQRLAAAGADDIESHCSDIGSYVRSTQQTYDLVCFSNSLQFCPDHVEIVDHVASNLIRPGGFLYITGTRLIHRGLRKRWERLHSAFDYKLYRMRTGYVAPRAAQPSVNYEVSATGLATTLQQQGFDVQIDRYKTFHTALFQNLARFTRPVGFFSLLAQRPVAAASS